MREDYLVLDNLVKIFGGTKESVVAVDQVSLQVREGELYYSTVPEHEKVALRMLLTEREEALIRALRILGVDHLNEFYYTAINRTKDSPASKKAKKKEIDELNELLKKSGEETI